MRPINLTRCPAPARTDWGILRCVAAADRCTTTSHRRWDRVRRPMALLWWVRPWWPNRHGRAVDRRSEDSRPALAKALLWLFDRQDGVA